MTENICIVVFRVLAKNCRKPKTGSSKKQILIETLQSVQSVELFNFNRAPTARVRQGSPATARGGAERLYLPKKCAGSIEYHFFATPDASRSRKCLIYTYKITDVPLQPKITIKHKRNKTMQPQPRFKKKIQKTPTPPIKTPKSNIKTHSPPTVAGWAALPRLTKVRLSWTDCVRSGKGNGFRSKSKFNICKDNKAPRTKESQRTTANAKKPGTALFWRKPKTRSTRRQVLFETLQSVQSVELFNLNTAPRTREHHGEQRSAWQPKMRYIYLKNAPEL